MTDPDVALGALLARLREAQAQYVGTSLTAPEVVYLLVHVDGLMERLRDTEWPAFDDPAAEAAEMPE